MPEYFEITFIVDNATQQIGAIKTFLADRFNLRVGENFFKEHSYQIFQGRTVIVSIYQNDGAEFDEIYLSFPDQIFRKAKFVEEIKPFTEIVDIFFQRFDAILYGVCGYETNINYTSEIKTLDEINSAFLSQFPIVYSRGPSNSGSKITFNPDAQDIFTLFSIKFDDTPDCFYITFILDNKTQQLNKFLKFLLDSFNLQQGRNEFMDHRYAIFAFRKIGVVMYHNEQLDFDRLDILFPDQVFHKPTFDEELKPFTEFVNLSFAHCDDIVYAVCGYETPAYYLGRINQLMEINDYFLENFPLVYRRIPNHIEPSLVVNLDAEDLFNEMPNFRFDE